MKEKTKNPKKDKTFRIFEKYNCKIGEFSSRKIHSGMFHCSGMDLAWTRDNLFHSGTVPGNLELEQIVTLFSQLRFCERCRNLEFTITITRPFKVDSFPQI